MRPFATAALLIVLSASAASAQVEGIGYRLNPTVTYIDFEGDASLSDGLLYGGGLGLSFGEFFELGGSFLYGPGFDTDVSAYSGLDGAPDLQAALAGLDPRGVTVQRYGGDLKINLLTTALVPYLTAGTGIIRFEPDDLDATRAIYLLGGAGLQLTLADRYALSVSAEDVAYRYNPGSTFFSDADLDATGLSREAFNEVTVHNWALRAAARVYIGGRRPGDFSEFDRAFQRQFAGGLGGLSLVVEPFYARADFADAFAYRDQTFVGAEAGFDFGPLVGLRGFYGRGTEASNPTGFESIQLYGGDIRFRLSEGRGLVPFISVGGGYLDVLDGYATDEGAEPENAAAEDNPFAAGGVGVGFLLSPRFRAIAEARALLMSTQDADDVSQPEDVYLSTLYRAGVSFALGGRAGQRVEVVRQSELDAERAAFEAERMAMELRRDSLRAELEALALARDIERAEAAQREQALLLDLDARLDSARAIGDSLAVARLEADQERLRTRIADNEAALARADSLRDAQMIRVDSIRTRKEIEEIVVEEEIVEADHMVTIPLPREGELYVRYGPPGGVVIESGGGASEMDLRAAVRAALIDLLDSDSTLVLTEADVVAVEDRVVARLAARTQPAPTGTVTTADLDRLEARLESRFLEELRALRRALADGEVPVDNKADAVLPGAEGEANTNDRDQ